MHFWSKLQKLNWWFSFYSQVIINYLLLLSYCNIAYYTSYLKLDSELVLVDSMEEQQIGEIF